MLAWWVSDLWNLQNANGKVILVAWVYWVIFSIVLHELAHGRAAIACGDRTPIETGHMTWNPLVHMGPISLMMFAIAGIAWGLMPIDPTRFRRKFDDAIVAAAGPVMNLVLAGVSLVLYGVWVGVTEANWFGNTGGGANISGVLRENVNLFLRVGIMLNLTLCLFNLIPAPPLDGSRIVANFVPEYRRFLQSEQGMQVTIAAVILLFMFASGPIWDAAFRVTRRATDFVDRLILPSQMP